MANCPYCNIELQKVPQRKTKCKSCGEYIYVKRRPSEEVKKLVTESEALEIEKEWNIYLEEKYKVSLLDKVSHLGYGEDDIKRFTGELAAKFGGAPRESDVLWRIYNDALLRHSEYGDKRIIYWEMARVVDAEGRDARDLQKSMHLCDLYNWKSVGIYTAVKIFSCDHCENCDEVKGKVYTINEAISLNVLPHKNCSNYQGNDKYPFCTCDYSLHDLE